MQRPTTGRAGAVVLILAACLLFAQALNSGAGGVTGVRFDPPISAAQAAGLSLPAVGRPRPKLPLPVAERSVPQAVVPLGRQSIGLPILMYHYIRVNPDPNDHLGYGLSVTPTDFDRQLDWLAASGYHPVDFSDVRDYFAGRRPLPARPVVLTFDDGYRDMYTAAYPALKAHHFKAVSYVVTGFVGAPNYMDWDMIRELEAGGMEIGAHTVSHIDLTTASPDELHRQLVDSEQTLAAQLGHPVVDFCYPAGRFNDAVVAAVQAAGYQTATTTQPGTVHSAGDRFTWSRVRVSGGEPLDEFIASLGAPEPTVTLPGAPGYVRVPARPRPPLAYAYPLPLPLPLPPPFGDRLLLP